MHGQTPGSTTATMAYPTAPASPTLTNPDMILPYGEEFDKEYELPSSGGNWKPAGEVDMPFSLELESRAMVTSTTPIIYGNGTMLSDIGEVTEAESTPGRKLPGPAERRMLKQAQVGQPLRSSPTIGHSALVRRTRGRSQHLRRASVDSNSTVTSEGHVPELHAQAPDPFNDFDDGVSVDDSNFQGDDEQSVADSYSEEVFASETQRLAKKDVNMEMEDEDRNSSAALSRRAEQILLNAKKRLNNMEGNLTRARSTLYTTSSGGSLSSIHSSSPLTRSTPSPQNERKIPTQLSLQSKQHRLHTPADSPMASPGHSRVFSESIVSDLNDIPRAALRPTRSSSAAARYMGRNSLDVSPTHLSGFDFRDAHGSVLQPLSEDDSPGVLSRTSSARSSIDENYISASSEHRSLTRSASSLQMRGLKEQMNDLKGRVSVLRDRTRDDMKRRSMQSLRSPSPFTAAEEWYLGAESYNKPGLSADAGVGLPSPLEEDEMRVRPFGDGRFPLPQDEIKYPSKVIQSSNQPSAEASSCSDGDSSQDYHETHMVDREGRSQERETYHTIPEEEESDCHTDYDTATEDSGEYTDDILNLDELEGYESEASLYHDSRETPISHEDREDAFDYEHFFLHSAMGTIGQQRKSRRGSFSSEDSVETTRGPAALTEVQERPSLGHLRAESTDSVSTVDTFQTAPEDRGSESDEATDVFAVRSVVGSISKPVPARRLTFGAEPQPDIKELEDRPTSTIYDPVRSTDPNGSRPSFSSFESFSSTGSQRSFPLINKPGSHAALNGGLTPRPNSQPNPTTPNEVQSRDALQSSPVDMLGRDDQILVERLVASLGKCVLGLQEAGRGSYESRVWRRRIDFARRTLEGLETEAE